MIKPHGADALKPLFVYDTEKHHTLAKEAESLPSLLVNSAAAANAVMLGAGYFTPLDGYMTLADALSVADKLHTTDGLFWPVPIIHLTKEAGIKAGSRIALRDPNVEGNPVLAIMDVQGVEAVSDEQIQFMAKNIFGTVDPKHPGVSVFTQLGNTLLSGPIQVLNFSYFQAIFPTRSALRSKSAMKFRSAAGKKSSPSRPATRCTARTKNCAAWRRSVCRPMASLSICCSAN